MAHRPSMAPPLQSRNGVPRHNVGFKESRISRDAEQIDMNWKEVHVDYDSADDIVTPPPAPILPRNSDGFDVMPQPTPYNDQYPTTLPTPPPQPLLNRSSLPPINAHNGFPSPRLEHRSFSRASIGSTDSIFHM